MSDTHDSQALLLRISAVLKCTDFGLSQAWHDCDPGKQKASRLNRVIVYLDTTC